MTTIPADGSQAGFPTLTTFGSDLPERPPQELPLLVVGAASGAGASLAAMAVYQLIRIGWHLASQLTQHGTAAPGPVDSPDRIFGVLIVGGLLSLAPTVLAGGVLGADTGWFLTVTAHRQGPVRSWLSGSLSAYVAALIVNLTVLLRHRVGYLSYHEWQHEIGIPSLIFVLVFGGIGVYLHLRQRGVSLP